MIVHISPEFSKKDKGDGGIRRVVEAQLKYLPELGIELVDDPHKADLVNCHATELVDHPLLVHSCHGLYWSDYQWANWAYVANLRVLAMMKQAEVVTVPSRWVANAVQRGTLIDPIVCPHGIEPKEWEPQPNEGYVFWGKSRPDPVCDPVEMNRLAAFAENIPFVSTFGSPTGNVKVLGVQPFDKMKPLLQGAAVYLGTVLETGGITVLESMASGIPVLGWRFGANEELVIHKETGYLAEPGNYTDLLDGLYYCLQNRSRLAETARTHVLGNYTWEQMIVGYKVAYVKALRQSTERRAKPKVSVIVRAYNLEEYLPACIGSVLAQTFTDWELIIVNDASTDSTGVIAEAAKNKHPELNIQVIHNETNQYLAEAHNIGMRASSGEYIMPLDADDQLAPYALELLSRALDKGKSLDIVTGAMEVIEPSGKRWVSDWPNSDISAQKQLAFNNQLPYASMFRRWVFDRTGGYRRRMKTAEDPEFWSRAFSYGARAAKVVDAPTLIYTLRRDSISNTLAAPDWLQWMPWSKLSDLAPSGFSENGQNVHAYHPLEVSVVIPCGPGHEIYLQDALDSLVAQTFQQWEAIVVNDTGHPIDKYVQGFPFVKVINPPKHVGVATARNLGIEAASTPLFFLLDADDWLQCLAIEAHYQAWQQHGGFVYSDWYDEKGMIKESQNWNSSRLLDKMLGPCTGIYSKKDWELVGGFDPNVLWEDWSYMLSLLEHDICGSRIASPLWTYRYYSGKRREEIYAKADVALKQILEKHKRLYEECQ